MLAELLDRFWSKMIWPWINFCKLCACKIHENINIVCQAQANILPILNEIGDTPEIMRQMPPVLVKLNEEVANSLLGKSISAKEISFSSLRCSYSMMMMTPTQFLLMYLELVSSKWLSYTVLLVFDLSWECL